MVVNIEKYFLLYICVSQELAIISLQSFCYWALGNFCKYCIFSRITVQEKRLWSFASLFMYWLFRLIKVCSFVICKILHFWKSKDSKHYPHLPPPINDSLKVGYFYVFQDGDTQASDLLERAKKLQSQTGVDSNKVSYSIFSAYTELQIRRGKIIFFISQSSTIALKNISLWNR